MARRKNEQTRVDLSAFDQAGARVIDNPLTTEVEDSYLEYAYSVIHSRALPDARDGLKPVHRRILFSMFEQGHRPDRPYVKSARVVGDTMGRYHPHGNTAIYDAMVRLAQDFSLNVPLIDGHGNFGSPDDGPAAERYTEARMSREAMLLVGELGEGTVDFKPNYDGSEMEPRVLPAAFPNLLVNGTSGIAVGMATNMIPHNLGEVVAAARWLIKHPGATLDKLLSFVPGPDLPTGGQLLGLDEVRRAYETGRGVVRMRARATTGLLEGGRGRQAITVVELPYGVGSEKIIEAITDEVKGKLYTSGPKKGQRQAPRLQGIADVKDLTDREHGTRLVIECKVGVNPQALLADLYRLTPLESSFGINNLVLVDGQPTRSCLVLAVQVDGRQVTTVEGLSRPDHQGGQVLHPIQEAFRECHALQCGFCTPGFLTTIAAGLDARDASVEITDEEVEEMVGGNLCRCTGYANIKKACRYAADTMRESARTAEDGAR